MYNPVVGTVTSEWSKNRVNPVTGKKTTHSGIDIAAPIGAPVHAAFGGKVLETRTNSFPGDKQLWKGLKSGNFIAIQNTDGAVQWYGHLDTVKVKAGDVVTEGQIAATVGRTGMVTGPHLHFETWSKNKIASHFNPRILFNRYKLTPGKASTPPPAKKYHTVVKGDTSWDIARKNGITLGALAKLNPGVRLDLIKPGQKLRVK